MKKHKHRYPFVRTMLISMIIFSLLMLGGCNDNSDKIEALETQIIEIEQKNTKLEESNKKLKSEIEKSKKSIEDLKKSNKDLENKLKKSKEENKKLVSLKKEKEKARVAQVQREQARAESNQRVTQTNNDNQSRAVTPVAVPVKKTAPQPVKESPKSETVYVTKSGEKYHTQNCVHLRRSSIPKDYNEAIRQGYTPCKNCH